MSLSVLFLNKKIVNSHKGTNSKDFFDEFHTALEAFEMTIEELDYPIELFGSEEQIWPDQREFAQCQLHQTQQSLIHLLELATDDSKVPRLVLSKRHYLSILLNQALELLQAISRKVEKFTPRPEEKSPNKIELTEELKKLQLNLNELSVEASEFGHRARFLANRL